MMRGRRDYWSIVRSRAVVPLSVTVDAAYSVKVARGASTRDMVVEFAAPSSVTSVGYAEEVARRFLTAPEPPQHLVVDVGGAVRMLHGPLEETPAAGPSLCGPGRARPRRRS